MCISVHEMTTAQVEEEIASCYRFAENPRYAYARDRYLARAKNLEKVVKERADAGTY